MLAQRHTIIANLSLPFCWTTSGVLDVMARQVSAVLKLPTHLKLRYGFTIRGRELGVRPAAGEALLAGSPALGDGAVVQS